MSDVIEVYGMDKVLRPLERLSNLDAMRGTMRQACELVRAKVATEPAPYANTPKRWFFSGRERQRAWWFATHKPYSHGAKSNYQRTHTLSTHWRTHVEQDATGLEGHVTNDTDYAKWVQTKETQARIHQKRWITEETAVSSMQSKVNSLFTTAAERWLSGGA